MLFVALMSLVENLQKFLTRVREHSGGLSRPTREELAHLRMHLRARFEQSPSGPAHEHQWRPDEFRQRLDGLQDFAFAICVKLDELPLRQDERLDALRRAIDFTLPFSFKSIMSSNSSPSPIWDEPLYELVREAQRNLEKPDWERVSTISRYASELQLVKVTADAIRLTPMGDVLLQLKRRDALRWLLAAEVVQSLPPKGSWCMSREDAASLATMSSFLPDDDELPWSPATIDRCLSFGLLDIEEFEDEEEMRSERQCWVTALGRELLAEAGSQETPFTLLAQAMIADQTQAVLMTLGKSSPHAAVEATVRHTRMVVHEIRNALVPVRFAVKQLWRDLGNAGQEGLAHEPRQTIDGNIERIFRFLEDSIRLSRLASAPPELFELLPAIRDAIVGLEQPPRGPIEPEIEPGADAAHVRGHRRRLVLALVNLLRNAVQAGGPDVAIAIQVAALPEHRRIQIIVDDDGPGIAPEQRGAIFQNGISHRSDGTGHGLTLVREVIEREMSGKISCENSPRGGARFVIELPWA
jgi:signal transduction histidine kinase